MRQVGGGRMGDRVQTLRPEAAEWLLSFLVSFVLFVVKNENIFSFTTKDAKLTKGSKARNG